MDAATRHPAPSRRRRRRWPWITLGVVVVLLPVLFLLATRSFLTRRLVTAIASGKLGGVVSAASVEVGLDGHVLLHRVELTAPHGTGEGAVVCRIRRLDVVPLWGTLLSDNPRLVSVEMDDPLLRFSQDVDDGSINVGKLTLPAARAPADLRNPPHVNIKRGILELGEHQGIGYRPLRRLDVDGSITRDASKPDEWLVVLRQIPDAAGVSPLDIQGRIAKDGLSLSLAGLALSEWNVDWVPTPLRESFRQLDLKGRVGATTFTYTPDGDVRARMRLDDVALNLPVETQPEEDQQGHKLPLPPEQVGRQLRLEQVRGTLEIIGGELIGDFSGKIDELPYHVKLSYGGASADAPFTLELRCSGFEMRSRPQVLRFAPGVAQRRFAQFSYPTGTLDAIVIVRRPAPVDGKPSDLSVSGDIVMRDGTASFERFPYLFEHMSGHWRFDESQLEIVQLNGVAASGARVSSYGRISPLTDEAGADIQVEITGLPIDDQLEQALGPRRRILDALFNRQRYQELLDAGLVVTPQQHAQARSRLAALERTGAPTPEQASLRALLERPVFALGGKVGVLVEVQREPGPAGEWTDTITIRLPEVGVLPERFPLPLIAHGANIIKQDELATVTGGVYSGLRGGSATVSASVDLAKVDDPGVPFVPEVQLSGRDLPVDDLLIHAVPQRLSEGGLSPRELLQQLHVAGVIPRAQARIGMSPAGDTLYAITLGLDDLAARPLSPEGSPRLEATRLGGSVVVTQDSVSLHLAGLLGMPAPSDAPRTPVTLAAEVTFPEGAAGAYDADARARNIDASAHVEDFVRAVSGPGAARIAALRDEYAPAGTLNAQVRITGTTPTDGPARQQIDVVARQISGEFRLGELRVGVPDAQGVVRVREGDVRHATFEQFAGSLRVDGQDCGTFNLDGRLGLDLAPARPGDRLGVIARDARMESPLVRRVLAGALGPRSLAWYDRFAPKGGFDADLDLRAPEQLERGWAVSGSISPKSLEIRLPDGPLACTGVGGSVELTPDGGSLRDLHVATPRWRAGADGTWTRSDAGETSLVAKLQGASQGIDPQLLALLPAGVGDAVRQVALKADGDVTLHDGTLSLVLPEQGELRGVRFEGTLESDKTSASAGVDVVDAQVSASLLYQQDDRGRGTLDVRALAQHAKVEGVNVTRARLRLLGEEDGALRVPLFSAECHGGRVAGTASVTPRPDATREYEADVRLADVRFASLVKDLKARRQAAPAVLDDAAPPPPPPEPEGSPDESRGRLDAQASLGGTLGQDSTRRGRGTLVVGGERVLNIPLLVPLVRITNLQLPINEQLDFASAEYYLEGDRMTFERLCVSSRSVEILGAGSAILPDFDLDLRFRARNVHRIPILSRVVEGIRNELVSGEVRGTVANPTISLSTLRGTRQIMGEVFGNPPGPAQRSLDRLDTQSPMLRRPAGRQPVPAGP